MTQWVIVAYLCSPLIAPAATTGCMFETNGPYPSEEACLSADWPAPDSRTFTVRALVCTPLLAGPDHSDKPQSSGIFATLLTSEPSAGVFPRA
jgi:hypothetical protein